MFSEANCLTELEDVDDRDSALTGLTVEIMGRWLVGKFDNPLELLVLLGASDLLAENTDVHTGC